MSIEDEIEPSPEVTAHEDTATISEPPLPEAVMQEIDYFCALYTTSTIMRLREVMYRIDCSSVRPDAPDFALRYLSFTFERRLLPKSGTAKTLLPEMVALTDVVVFNRALQHLFKVADSWLVMETGRTYIQHELNTTRDRRKELGLEVEHSHVVLLSDIARSVAVPDKCLVIVPGTFNSGTSALNVTLTIPHIAVDVDDWQHYENADTELVRYLLSAFPGACQVPVLRVLATSDDTFGRLDKKLLEARSEFIRQATHNDTGFLISVPELPQLYKHALRGTETLFD